MWPCTHYRQSASSNLCAYYSLKHYLLQGNKDLREADYLTLAAGFYMHTMDPSVRTALNINSMSDARDFAQNGNDPGAIIALLRKLQEVFTTIDGSAKPTFGDLKVYDRIILCLKKRRHFIAILKSPEGEWYNYDSLMPASEQIADVNQFLVTTGESYLHICGR